MGKNLLVGIGGKARHVKALYVGVGGKARKVKKVYVGVGGKARLVYQSYIPVTGISISWPEPETSEDIVFTVTFTPSNATDKSVTWSQQYSPHGVEIISTTANTCTVHASDSRSYNYITATTSNGIYAKIKCGYLAWSPAKGDYWLVQKQ